MQYRLRLLVVLLAAWCGPAASAEIWRTGYFPGWEQDSMSASAIDFSTITHVIHFAATPIANGALDTNANGLTMAKSLEITSQAHTAGRKVLICIGGAGAQAGFQGGASAANLPGFIANITNLVAVREYDGVDIDWEPLPTTDAQSFSNLIKGLRTALNGFSQPKLLTAAVGAYPPYGDSPTAQYVMYAALQSQFDQLNVMTYDLSGPYDGWVTWFNSPLYDGGYRFASSGGLVPSIDVALRNYLDNGVAPGKLGLGLPFYGYVWTGAKSTSTGGVTLPRQSWTTAPSVTAYGYATIMDTYYQSNRYHWDSIAQAAYLSVTNANPTNSMFISYDDQRACQAKVSYVRNHNLGGLMIWALGQDYTSGQGKPLLQSIKLALATPGALEIQRSNQDFNLGFISIPLGSYRVQWTSNLTGVTGWNTLAVTNVSGPGGRLQVTDPNSSGLPLRFYRVQTPP